MRNQSPSIAVLRAVVLPLAVLTVFYGVCGADKVHFTIKSSDDWKQTMHTADSVEFRFGSGAPAVITADVEKGILAPELIPVAEPITDTTAIAIGISSWGSGMATLHAILLMHTGEGTRISDQLVMNVKRGLGGMAWSKDHRLYLINPLTSIQLLQMRKVDRDESLHSLLVDDEPFFTTTSGKLGYTEIKSLKFKKKMPAEAKLVYDSMLIGVKLPKYPSDAEVLEIPIADGRFDISALTAK